MSENEEMELEADISSEDQILEILSSMALNKTQKDIVLRVPGKYRLQYAKCLSSPSSRALSVKMKCYECVGFESVSDRIGNCTCRMCPLWLHRPFQEKKEVPLSE